MIALISRKPFLSKSVFSLFYCNVRSLEANHDNLVNMLFELYHPFSIIGISETKFTHKKDSLINIDIPHYKFLSQSTLSNSGGVGFFVHENLDFTIRRDLSLGNCDFESLWIEVGNH